MKMKKVKGKNVVLSLVCLVLGYMIAFSYHFTQKEIENEKNNISGVQWERTLELRNQLNEQKEENRKLAQELHEKQDKVLENEKDLATEAEEYINLAEDAETYRMYLGKVKVKGKGVTVTLADGAYDPKVENINNYLVHEYHVFKVINELYISGAEAIAINGQRLTSHSYILCTGPVITVDGIQHPAPFEITAIGDPEVLTSALNLTGGVKDQIVNDNIVFTLEKKNEIILNPIIASS